MALSATLVWEARTTGSAANGAAFRAGATGTDYSQQDSAQVSYTDLTVDASTSTRVTSAANPFTAAHVGNVINISSTSPWTAGYYEVVSVAGSVATLDRSPAAVGTAGGVGKLGGATNSPETIAGAVVSSNVVWIKSGTYNVVAAYFTATTVNPSPTSPRGRISGYAATRGDSGRATLKCVGAYVWQGSYCIRTGNGWDVEQIDADGAGNAWSPFYIGQRCSVTRCKALNGRSNGINVSSVSTIQACEVTGMTGGLGAISGGQYGVILENYVHDNACPGIVTSNTNVIRGNIVANNTGASSDGIQVSNFCQVIGNTVYGNGGHGLNETAAENFPNAVQGNIFANNGGYGAVFASVAGNRATSLNDGNAYYNNTGGTRLNGNDTTVNPQFVGGAYANPRDKILTATPFMNAASGDFRLNDNAGGGAACRGVGLPATWPGSSVAGYPDLGAAQHQDTASAGTGGGRVIGSPVILPARRMV